MSKSDNVKPLAAVPSEPRERSRQLIAVLAADAVSFTSHMERNPGATVDAIERYRRLIQRLAAGREGALVDSPGDFMLMRFSSVEAAVLTGLDFLDALDEERGARAAEQRLDFRMGAHVGDVFEVGRDILGTAVNIAARLQQHAGVNTLVVSDLIHDQLEGHARIAFQYIGNRDLKNVHRPVRVYAARARRPDDTGNTRLPPVGRDNPARYHCKPLMRPTIKIVPFRPIDNSETNGLFAASLTEELLASLGCISGAVVIRDEDSKSADTNSYILSGSVRESDRVRVVAKITGEASGETIWTDRYDFDPDDNFDAEERISKQVITALQVQLTEGEQAELWNERTTSLKAWEYFQRGRNKEALYRRESHLAARRWYTASLEQDDRYTPAIVALGFCYIDEIRLGWCADENVNLRLADEQCLRAEALDNQYPGTRALRAYIYFLNKDFDMALRQMRDAASLAPNNLEIVAYYGAMLDTLGRFDEAVDCYERAIQLSRYPPAWVVSNLGLSYLLMGEFEMAKASFENVISGNNAYLRAYIGLAIVAAQRDDIDGARKIGRQILTLDPGFSVDKWARSELFMDQGRLKKMCGYLRLARLG